MQLHRIDHLYEKGGKKNQEDYLWPEPGTAGMEEKVFIVADGVGGSENGEIASRIVAQTVGAALEKVLDSHTPVNAGMVNQLLETASHRLMEYAITNHLNPDMATTFTLLLLGADRCFVCWCGDSRVYQIRQGQIVFQTADHSLVHSLVRAGELSEEEARFHPQKNLLLRAVRADGTNPDAEAQWLTDVRDGDFFLLCSDGLLENIGPPELNVLLTHTEGVDLARAFEDLCKDRTRDNYSMYLVQIASVTPKATAVGNSGTRQKWISLLISIGIIAAAFILKKNYFGRQDAKQSVNIDMIRPVNRPADSAPDTAIIKPKPASLTDTAKP